MHLNVEGDFSLKNNNKKHNNKKEKQSAPSIHKAWILPHFSFRYLLAAGCETNLNLRKKKNPTHKQKNCSSPVNRITLIVFENNLNLHISEINFLFKHDVWLNLLQYKLQTEYNQTYSLDLKTHFKYLILF